MNTASRNTKHKHSAGENIPSATTTTITTTTLTLGTYGLSIQNTPTSG